VTLWALAGTILVAVAAYFFLSGFLATWLRYRGKRVITCPENLEPAAVHVNALKAAHWAAISGDSVLRLNECSRWPEKAGCGQECLSQIQASPDGCAVNSIVTKWYAGRDCAFCRKPIGPIVWHERPPAVRSATGVIREWKDIPAEQLPSVFASHVPVCFSCSLTERMLIEPPELVVNRVQPPHREPTLTPTAQTY
jgi:hypothetical protein